MRPIDSILAVADNYAAIVFDQWGVLHNGTTPYPQAVATIVALYAAGKPLGVLSNSGKRADVNLDRIAGMGFARDAFDVVMTSGEALHRDIKAGHLGPIKTLYPVTALQGDAEIWAKDLPINFTDDLAQADAVLLMGLPDGHDHSDTRDVLTRARHLGKLLICSNPDRASPRADGVTVISPGALAHDYADAGGKVVFYGKPHPAIFDAVSRALGITDPSRILMVGDSPEHDIAGAHTAGWDSVFISGGLHAADAGDLFKGTRPATYSLSTLR